MHGTWQVTGGGGGGARLIGGIIATVALLSWLATVLWLIVVIGISLVIVTVAVLILLLRRPRAETEALAERAAALRAEAAPRMTPPAPAQVIHYHGGTHLHIEPGADAAAVIRQAELLRAGPDDAG